MLLIAGQTAGPIGLKFFEDGQGVLKVKKSIFPPHGQRPALQLVSFNSNLAIALDHDEFLASEISKFSPFF